MGMMGSGVDVADLKFAFAHMYSAVSIGCEAYNEARDNFDVFSRFWKQLDTKAGNQHFWCKSTP